MSKLNNTIKLFSVVFIILFVSACSTTNVTSTDWSDNNWANQTVSTNNLSLEKKSFSSDHQLLLSLLNRPLPEDQLMMMRFAQVQYGNNQNNPQVNYVNIRGNRSEEKSDDVISFAFSNLIYKDQNSIAIGAPR